MEHISINIPPRRSTADPVQNATLFVGDRSIVLDERNMPARLARLIPPGYGTINHPNRTQRAWMPFVVLAEAMGALE